MNSSLKSQPQFDGTTGYCNKSFNLVNQKSPGNLETLLRNLNKTGPMLGTRIFGRRKSKNKKVKSSLKYKSKHRSKHRSRKRRFGQTPFLEGKLSTSVQTEGLPLGARSPVSYHRNTNIYQTFPNIFRQGSPLPRPYGPRDNLRMQSLYDIHGFGRRKSKSKKRCKCGKKHKSRSRRRSRKFGNSTTPGSPEWKHNASARNKVSAYMNQYANAGRLSMAKGWTAPSALYMRSSSSNIPNVIGMPNEPAQFSNNQLNSPVLLHFGKKKKVNKKKSRPSLSKSQKSFAKSKKRPRRFGPLVPNVAGPNTVGYQASIPLYHAGANTIDFATNQMFRPDIVGSIGKVQSDGMTSKAWLTQSVGIGDGLGNKYRFGRKKQFGNLVYTPDGVTYGTGHNTIMQPSYLKKVRAFGGSVITLNSAGQIQITRPSKT